MHSKRFNKITKNSSLDESNIKDLLGEIKKNCTAKFDESIDLSFQINNKQKKNEINIRTSVNLPSGSGKKVTVAVVCEENKHQDAKDSGADLVGGDDLMIKLSKLGKVLGPKGLMPNPKLGTVNEDISGAVKNAKSGQVEIRNDKDGNIGLSIGKKSFSDENLIKNFDAIIDTLEKEKTNNNIKGNLIRSSFVTSSMGISYKLKLDKSI